jgi:hypothetical protein
MKAQRRILLAIGAAILIPACGGGGGSDGAPAASQPSQTSLGDGQPPLVRIVSPGSGTTCHEGATVTLQAVAVDPDALIARVDFFDGSKPIGSKLAPPFNVSWSGVKAGAHIVTAVAFDVQGLSATSDPVTIFVVARDGDEDDDRDGHGRHK